MAERLINIYQNGQEECEHKWLYKSPIRTTFSIPPKYVQTKLCEKCGRLEYIENDELKLDNISMYEETLKKFKEGV